ncbi:GEVED domain-containing protein [Chryseobacterium sp. JJR-5R]|uniref:GEVED domain-containing protein n=1 Tax=Chryseobacterium sp. JJR-5R TaxID=3093923 RepID=UPI002A75D4A6|nr:GEVED domain-containing protein [Chryseobacterium sp. JJR-5R]WPO83876.1 GEVED domain-containing protein [Chryseobacterium sp. JJR-5R]
MKKILSVGLFSLALSAYAQSYCVPEFASGCAYGDQINSFTIPGAGFSHLDTGCSSGSYGDYTSQTINLNAGVNYPFTVTHNFSTQNVKMWIDFNNDGTFDETTELVASGSSVSGSVIATDGTITIPATAPLGVHRMRLADRYSSQPIPCNTDGYGEAHDYTVNIGAVPSCLAPTGVSVTGVADTTATLSWTAPSVAVGTGYEYYLSTSNTSPVSTTAATGSVASPAVSKSLTGLSPITTYYVWVRSVCTATDKSGWSSSATFTTSCSVIVPSYTFDFADGTNDCWSRADSGTPATTPSGTTSNWNDDGFLNNGYDGAVKLNIYTSIFSPTAFNAWLITPAFNLSAGGYRVKFDYGLTEYGNTTPGNLGSDDLVQFVVSQDGGTTWTVLQTWDTNTSPSNNSNQYVFNLTGYNSANTRFGFYGTNGNVADASDVEFFVDNFVVEQNVLSTNETVAAKNSVKVYPNPFSDVLNISDAADVKNVLVTDVSGRLIKTLANPGSAIQLGDLKQGIYLITLEMKNGSRQTVKSIKK